MTCRVSVIKIEDYFEIESLDGDAVITLGLNL